MLALEAQQKSSTTHHAEGNSIASPTQTIVGKGIPNPLTAEDLLKILRDLFPFDSPPKSLPIPVHRMTGHHKKIFISLTK